MSRRFYLLYVLAISVSLKGQVTVGTAQYNNARTGANLSETILNTSNVNTASFGKLFTRQLDSSVYALPLYIPKVAIPGQGVHNVVYVATMGNTVYAFDADDPAQSSPLWSRNVGPAFPNCCEQQPSWGIMGTPVIYNNTIYFVAYIGTNPNTASLYLCALDITTGQDSYGPPAEILFPLNGNFVSATPYTIQRAALLVTNNTLFVAFANFQTTAGDRSTQEGFVYSYALTNIRQPLARFQTTNGKGGDIWQAGRGLASDDQGYIYANTGNGYYDGITNFGDSVLKLASSLSLADWFTPANWNQLYVNDLDISASGPILIPGTDYLVACGKEGELYLLRQSHPGKLQVNSSGGPVEQFHATNGCYLTDCSQTPAMAYWRGQTNSMLYIWERGDILRAFPFNGPRLQTTPSAVSTLASTVVGGVAVSSNGSTAGSGIVWALTAGANADFEEVPGTLSAYNATNVAQDLWDSNMNAGRDAMGDFTKFSSPVIANGKVYAITQSNQLQVYGLLGSSQQ